MPNYAAITFSPVWVERNYSCQIYDPTPSSPLPIISAQELLAMDKEALDKIDKETSIRKLKEEGFTYEYL